MWLNYFRLAETHSLERRYDLDWLRVIAFGLLILFHIGMFYTANWGWHVKSEHRSVLLETVMLALNRWRMPLLWFISGVAMRIVLNKISPQRFLTQRSSRLLLPLLFGVLVIVPPQLYYQMMQQGDLPAMSYWQFYRAFFELDNSLFEHYPNGLLPHMDVNHLWFLRELWTFSVYIVLLTPVLVWLNVAKGLAQLVERHYGWTMFALSVVLFIIAMCGEDRNPQGLYFLLLGYLIGSQPHFWARAMALRQRLFWTAVVSYLMLAPLYYFVWLDESLRSHWYWRVLGYSFSTLLTGAALLALFGYARMHLNKPSKILSYLSDAALPYYIVHQTVIVVAAYNLSQLQWPVALEAALLIVITISACLLSYEIIRRITILRLLFGLSVDFSRYSKRSRQLIYVVQGAVLVPLAVKILL